MPGTNPRLYKDRPKNLETKKLPASTHTHSFKYHSYALQPVMPSSTIFTGDVIFALTFSIIVTLAYLYLYGFSCFVFLRTRRNRNHNNLQLRMEVTSSIPTHRTTSPVVFAHSTSSTTTIGDATNSHSFSMMGQEDKEEIVMQVLTQPPPVHLRDRVEKRMPSQDMC
jgi:hypothetical protein